MTWYSRYQFYYHVSKSVMTTASQFNPQAINFPPDLLRKSSLLSYSVVYNQKIDFTLTEQRYLTVLIIRLALGAELCPKMLRGLALAAVLSSAGITDACHKDWDECISETTSHFWSYDSIRAHSSGADSLKKWVSKHI